MLGVGEPAKGEANMRSASEEPVPLHEEFIYCCGAATHVLKCGPWKDLSKDESKNLPRLLFMIIPEGGLFSAGPILLQPLKPTEKFPLGILDPMQSSLQPLCQHRLYQTRDTNYIWDVKSNPGLAGYYRTFIQALYCGLNQQYPVWVVSHAGHCKPPSGMEMIEDTDIKELEDVFGLNGQVEHKLNFLKKNVSKDIKLVLIAHSIGCYITLEMMKRASELQILSMPMKTLPEGPVIKSLDPICSQAMKTQIPLSKVEVTDIAMMLSVALKKFAFPREQEFLQPIKENVLRSVLLFPTIERMAQSPQGKLMTPLLCKLRYVLYMPVYLLSFLPEGVKASLVRFALRGMKTCDESSITTSVNLFSVDCIANILYMASQEMMKVVERDSTTIKQNLKKLIFYYGTGDSWCPQQYYDEIKMDFPDGDIRLCEKGLRHAFVLDASKEMAAMITDWLQDDLTKL